MAHMASLADLQRAPETAPPKVPASLPLQIERVRTFDTPEFAGMTFLEVEAKSALNKVRGMPFPWSINPYRGCSHACSYCLAGDTPILMADGRTKPLADVRVGDDLYGTVVRGSDRRYVPTRVLDHWSTIKPAYRVVLEDGTELVASADHRFLTRRGWKHVTGAQHGRSRRPHLTANDQLMGTGRFTAAPDVTRDYRLGYLCGLIRGDGVRPSDHSIPTQEFAFAAGGGGRSGMAAIRNQTRAGVEEIANVVAWPRSPSIDWAKGFLAGIFDTEGGYSRGILRIANTDPIIIGQLSSCLRRFGFAFALENRPDGCMKVRLRGGLREHLRFFHTVDPAITRKRSIHGVALTSDAELGVVAVEPLGVDLPLYDITTGTGDFIANGVVSHNCFARPTHAYLNLSPLGDFERTVVVKTNLVEVLRRELARPSWSGEHVAMGTNTDPYQRCEGRYRLMPGVIRALADAYTPFSILTKGTMITRDLAGLQAAAGRVPVAAALTVGMLDETVWREAEPGTPSPRARLGAVRALNDGGIPTGVMLAPIMPGLNDDEEQLAALVEAAVGAGAVHVTPIVLHLRPGVREVFWPWLERTHPELVERYRGLYTRSSAAKEYRTRIEAFVTARRRAAWARHGRPPPPAAWRGRPGDERPPVTADPGATGGVHDGVAPAAGEQLSLL